MLFFSLVVKLLRRPLYEHFSRLHYVRNNSNNFFRVGADEEGRLRHTKSLLGEVVHLTGGGPKHNDRRSGRAGLTIGVGSPGFRCRGRRRCVVKNERKK